MKIFFNFGEKVKGYEVPVLNEREVRAASGILLVGALIAFMNAWLIGNFIPLKLFVSAFFVDFFIRLIINPAYAPTMVVARFATNNQKVEYTGAPQKRFAWIIGLVLSSIMLVRVVLLGLTGPINLLLCLLCLIFLFFEAAFGICLGCYMYPWFFKEKAKLCPGGVCDVVIKQPIQKIYLSQVIGLVFFIVSLVLGYHLFSKSSPTEDSQKECDIPEWVANIGHEEMYRLHHNCN